MTTGPVLAFRENVRMPCAAATRGAHGRAGVNAQDASSADHAEGVGCCLNSKYRADYRGRCLGPVAAHSS